MKKWLTLLLLSITLPATAQVAVVSGPPVPSQKQQLSTDAYLVFKTNKFLDFKNKDLLLEYIDDTLYKKQDLNNYFGYEKDWDTIEKEDTASYRRANQEYTNRLYTYTDSSMTEYFTKGGSYSICREIRTVLNPKAFILLDEEKIFVGDNHNETRRTVNVYDEQNRVVKIIQSTERPKKEESSNMVTSISYAGDRMVITTAYGTINCHLVKDSNAVGYISKLGVRETFDYFKYALKAHDYRLARKYCTGKLQQTLDTVFCNTIADIDFGSAVSKHSFQNVNFTEEWKITFDNGVTRNYEAEMMLLQLPNGWKIDSFILTDKKEMNK